MKITREWLIQKGFKQIEKFDHYHLAIDLNLSTSKSWIDASLLPHDKWMAFYAINGIPASKTFTTTEEIETFLNAVI